jgi:rhodanese-related sulfurtransferase
MACHEGAGRAVKFGYKNVFVMPAGIQGWEKAGLPVEK